MNLNTAESDAWSAKFEQVYQKAKLAFGSDPSFARIQALYDRKSVQKQKTKRKEWLYLIIPAAVFLFGLFGVFLFTFQKGQKETRRLEALYQGAITSLEKGDYRGAKLKANDLIWSVDTSNWDGGDSDKKNTDLWNKKRQALFEEIKEQKPVQ
jgi:hypothetical protein